MILVSPFHLTLRDSPGNARASSQVRQGFLIRYGSGFGCVQPWPELGDPSVSELLERLKNRQSHPLLARALACAEADGAARKAGLSLFAGLSIPRSHATVPGEADFPLLAATGFHTVKLKARGTDPAIAQRVAGAANAGLKIRIDYNETGADTLPLLRPWAEQIEFIEDPEPYDPIRWRELASLTGFDLALDRLPAGVPDRGGYAVRVIKPALEECLPCRVEAVITSYMDHPLGQMFAAWEAARYPGRQREAGLLTHTLYEPDAFTEAVISCGPQLQAPAGTGLGFDDLLETLPWRPVNPATTVSPAFPPPLPADFWTQTGSLLLTNPRAPLTQPPETLPPGCLLFATSGSTGTPALVCLTREAMLANAAAANAWLQSTSHDIWLRPLPLFHVGGMSIHARAFLSGARVVCDDEKWDPEKFVRLLEENGVTLTSLVPAQVHDLVAGGHAAPPSLRAVIVGGGAMESGLLESARRTGWPLLPSYGLTEASSQVATARPGDETFPPRLELLPCWEGRISGESRLLLRGAPLCQGRLVHGADGWIFETATDGEGWFTTADRARLDGRFLTILGRSDRVVKVLGELVDLDSIEAALAAAGLPPGRGIVAALPDARAGMRPWLITDLPESQTSPLLLKAAAALPPFAAVAGCRHLPALPRSPLGKVLRAEVEALLRI